MLNATFDLKGGGSYSFVENFPARYIADLTNRQREEIIQVLDGMVRERSVGNGPAVLTAPLNIGIGTK